MSTYGRNRDSIADIEDQLHDIFANHPEAKTNADGETEIPATAVVSVLKTFGENNNGAALLDQAEEEKARAFLTSHPEISVTVPNLVQLVSSLTSHSPRETTNNLDDSDGENRGRDEESAVHSGSSRSSSRSAGTRSHGPPPLPPKTPRSARVPDSPFDSERRQRTAPLQHNGAPSAWSAKRSAPVQRRRSDASVSGRPTSDSESSRHSRPSSRNRARAPSNPTSPRMGYDSQDAVWGATSPPHISSPPMRPHSRAQSHGQFSSAGRYGSPEESDWGHNSFSFMRPENRRRRSSDHHDYNGDDSYVENSLSSKIHPRRRGEESDSDSGEDEDQTLGLVLDRQALSSAASLAPEDRLDALQRVNAELGRKLHDVERNLQLRLEDHETELERMETRLEEAKSELSATKREEKELRGRESKYTHQISTLESEVAKLQKNLENSKQSYQNLQRQYSEQCTESESLRNALRNRDQQYRDATDRISLHSLEIEKWAQQNEQMESTLANLENQLVVAREAQIQLDQQKQENLMLKETIDRMRFDMDELRSKADGNIPSTSGGSTSNQNTISKSLGQEILRMNNGKWLDEDESDEESETTAVDEEGDDGDNTEGEDVIQTIITRKKRKVASRAMKKMETIHVEDLKEYCDAEVQHEASEFTSSQNTQTEPEPKKILKSFSAQTASVPVEAISVQTDAEPVPRPIEKCEMSMQTEIVELEPETSRSRSPSSETDMASSSSTVIPPTPKADPNVLAGDLPPSYSQIAEGETQNERDMRVATEAIRKWHQGLHVPLMPIPGGVSEDAVEEWHALKEEMGFECLAIDKVIEMSLKTGQPRVVRDGSGSESDLTSSQGAGPSSGSGALRRYTRKNRFYNIYNTFVYGGQEGGHPAAAGAEDGAARPAALPANMLQTCAVAGLFALAVSALTAPYMQSQYVAGGPGYYDRVAWAEFNRLNPAGEGFVMDGAASVWDFLGRVGGEAARMARGGFPT